MQEDHIITEIPHHHSIRKTTLLAMVIFSIGYMISEPNLDGFTLEEALEYINNEDLESIPVHVAGFVTSFISNVPLLAAIIYCWVRKAGHHHDHDAEGHHHHSLGQELLELLSIGGPFALMGTAAYLNTIKELINIDDLNLAQQILTYSGAAVSGSITGFGAYKLHGFHVHGAMDENGGGIKGFFKGLYVTFIKNVWTAKDEHNSLISQVVAVFNELWKKYGIVAAHGFLGSFAAKVFLDETGLRNQSPIFDLFLELSLPIAVMLLEGNTEARSLDDYKHKQNRTVSYSLFSKLVVMLSGILHSIPGITSLASLLGSSSAGPYDGRVYNLLIYLAASSILAYPSVYGFFATTLPGFDEAATGLKNKINNSSHLESSRQDYEWIEQPQDEEISLCSRLLNKFGFYSKPKEDQQLLQLLFNLNEDDCTVAKSLN